MDILSTRILAIYWGRRGGGLSLFNQFVEECKDQEFPIFQSLRPVQVLKNGEVAPVSIFRLPSWLKTRKNLIATALGHNVDTAVFVMASPWDIFLGRRLMAAGINVVRIIHDGSPHPGEYFPSKFWIRWLTRDCSRIVTLSQFVANQLVSSFGVNPALINVCEFPMTRVKATEIQESGGVKRVLLIGRGKKYQGQSLLEEAWALIERPGVNLIIAGEGFVVKKNNPGVEYKNYWMSDEQLIDEIAASDLVVFPYIEASQSGTIPICQALGVPVIVTPVGGLPEQVKNGVNGLVLSEVSAVELAEAILSVLDNKLPMVSAQGAERKMSLVAGCRAN